LENNNEKDEKDEKDAMAQRTKVSVCISLEFSVVLSYNSTLETQKTAAAIRLPLKSQNTED